MSLEPAGSLWLKEKYQLSRHILTHSSYIGNNPSVEVTSKGNIDQVYGPKYRVAAEDPLHHLEFSLKYDDLNLDLLRDVFKNIKPADVVQFVAPSPRSKYARRIAFLYEFLTGGLINHPGTPIGNYIDLLDEDKYVTGRIKKNTRWRINDNLLGGPSFCPIVRKTKELKELLSIKTQDQIRDLKESYPPELFARVIQYLYRKETRSSYEIEQEQPAPDRLERFITLLKQAGTEAPEEMLTEQRLTLLQNAIVEPRFAATGFRDSQVYIGESLPMSEIVHYIGPPPAIVRSLMEGLKDTSLRSIVSPEIRAAIISFGFVFIHPFDDGNGRLHRFLIHDALVQDKMVPQGLIIPISAHMLNHIKDYDQVLEKYSKPLIQRIKFDRKDDTEIVVTNPSEVEGYFRYPDLTAHCIYMVHTVHATLAEDMPNELLFIQRYDEARKELQRIVDMPDKLLNQMLLFLHQNKGIFPKRRRDQFSKLTDEEILRMQTAYRLIYGMEPSV